MKTRNTKLVVAGFLLAAVTTALTTGCQTKPTVARETVSRAFGGGPALLGPIALNEDVVVVDARSAFDYSMARIPRSVAINWADYSEAEPTKRGWPQKDLFAATRRLARLGIAPDSKVVVLGAGLDGQGEEGRVAWLLAYLGVENVRFGRFGSVKAKLTTEALPESLGPQGPLSKDERPAQPPEAVTAAKPIWKPQTVDSLIVTTKEMKGVINNHAMEKPWGYAGRKAKLYRIIDVRPEGEYLGKSSFRSKSIPNLNAINVPWKEFFDADFRPFAETAQKLAAIQVTPQHRVIVIDNDGVASAAVVMALRAYGYNDAGVYAGGYNDLIP